MPLSLVRETAFSLSKDLPRRKGRAEFLWLRAQENSKKRSLSEIQSRKRRFSWRKGRQFRKKEKPFRRAALPEKALAPLFASLGVFAGKRRQWGDGGGKSRFSVRPGRQNPGGPERNPTRFSRLCRMRNRNASPAVSAGVRSGNRARPAQFWRGNRG